MRKHYIQLATTIQQIYPTGTVCVGSVHGNTDLQFSGGSDGSDPNEKPF